MACSGGIAVLTYADIAVPSLGSIALLIPYDDPMPV
jgi:hypothetical protein